MTTTETEHPVDAALDVEDLASLMRVMNDATEQLRTTHDALQQEVRRLKVELADANAELRRSRSLAALGEMAAGIAHEIRNPLGSIQLYSQALAEDLAETPQVVLCDKITRAIACLDAIVRDVLNFAREDRARLEPLCIADVVRQALTQCDGLLHDASVAVDLEIDDACSCHADATLLTQAIANVVRNAVEAMAECPIAERAVRVAVEQRKVRQSDGAPVMSVVIAITDSGPGIPAEVVERMFNPFFTTRATGTGLGLAIVHRILDAHGGRVRVPDSPRGARVELCLPIRPARREVARGSDEIVPLIETHMTHQAREAV